MSDMNLAKNLDLKQIIIVQHHFRIETLNKWSCDHLPRNVRKLYKLEQFCMFFTSTAKFKILAQNTKQTIFEIFTSKRKISGHLITCHTVFWLKVLLMHLHAFVMKVCKVSLYVFMTFIMNHFLVLDKLHYSNAILDKNESVRA